VGSPEEFWQVAIAHPAEMVENAMIFQGTAHVRHRLINWYEAGVVVDDAPSSPSENHLESAVKLLREAIAHGGDTIRCVLSRFSVVQRWETIAKLEEDFAEDMRRLMQAAPNWGAWCG
jgi:hypothetical protein